MKCIRTKKGLKTLLERAIAAKLDDECILTIKGCLESSENIAMDEMDYENFGKEYRKCCKGLK